MTGVITLTAAMRANLQSLQGTQSLLDQTQLRLSTGNKVNSALDNPINFFAAQTLNNRASDLSSLLDGMGQGIQVLKTTDQAITSLTSYVTQLKSLANSAKSALNQSSSQVLLETYADNGTSTAGMDSSVVADLTATGGITAGNSFSLQVGNGPAHTFVVDTKANGGIATDATGNPTLNDLVTAINQVQGLSASVVYGDGVSTSAAGGTMQLGLAYLKVTSTTGEAITAKDITGTSALAALGFESSSATITSGGSATTQIASYADIMSQVNQTVADANYQGTNLINGTGKDLDIEVNEKSQGKITVKSVDLSGTGLALDADASSWTSSANIDTAIAKIDAALATLRQKAGSFSNSLSIIQTRQDFTNNLVNTLKDGASQLTIADKNEEGANLLALQTSQQLGIQALALSSQANQSVLRLFS